MGIPLLLIVLVITIYVCNRTIQKNSETYIYSTVSDIPYNKVGLLLGTSPKLKSGKANLYFDYRIKAATELYNAGKVKYILVSGDNRRNSYNEPEEMKKALIAAGIPDQRIILDYAGLRTLDSVVRAHLIFGLERFTGKPIGVAVFYEDRAGFEKGKRGVGRPAFLGKLLNPFPVTRPFAAVVFAARGDQIKVRRSQIRRKRHRPQQRGATDAAVFGRNGEQKRQAFVGALLVFGGDREHDVLPSVAPVGEEARGDAFRALKLEVAPFTHDVPGFLAPRVGVFQKEVTRHASSDEFAGTVFEVTPAIALNGNRSVGGAADAAPSCPRALSKAYM